MLPPSANEGCKASSFSFHVSKHFSTTCSTLHANASACFHTGVEKSPASSVDIVLFVGKKGDLIVAINGTPETNSKELEKDLESRKENEQLSLTLHSLETKDKRVACVTLGKRS